MANLAVDEKRSVTVIAPMYNEAEMASVFFETIVPILEELPCNYAWSFKIQVIDKTWETYINEK